MNELTTVTLETILGTINDLGTKSKELCKQIYIYLTSNDTKEARVMLEEKTNLSKQSISQMFKAGRLYSAYPELNFVSHTNIVELAPIEYELPEATFKILGTGDITEWENYTQKEIRTLVKNYINKDIIEEDNIVIDEDTNDNCIDIVLHEEIGNFINYLKNEYDIDSDDFNTLKYYISLIK